MNECRTATELHANRQKQAASRFVKLRDGAKLRGLFGGVFRALSDFGMMLRLRTKEHVGSDRLKMRSARSAMLLALRCFVS